MSRAKVACRTPTAGRDGAVNIPAWKFDLLRDSILAVLAGDELPFAELADRVRARLGAEELARIGSLGWHVTTVKLELEVRGEIARSAGRGPQVLRAVRVG